MKLKENGKKRGTCRIKSNGMLIKGIKRKRSILKVMNECGGKSRQSSIKEIMYEVIRVSNSKGPWH